MQEMTRDCKYIIIVQEPCTCEDEEAANRVLFEATTRLVRILTHR